MQTRSIEVGVGALGASHDQTVVLDVHLPVRLAEYPSLMFCIPGGGVNRHYFNLRDDSGKESFSFAEALTSQGHVVVAADPLGIGQSSRPDDGFALTATAQADLLHHAFMAVRRKRMDGIDLGSLRPVGVGHSAGAMLSILQQTRHRDFDAMIVFCFSTGGLPHALDPEHLRALDHWDTVFQRLPDLAQARFGAPYFSMPRREPTTSAARALDAVQDDVLAVIALHSMTPGNVSSELAAIDVPIFLAGGGRDMTGPPQSLVGSYSACMELTLFVSPEAGHHIFVAKDSARLFSHLRHWLIGLNI